MYYLFEAAIKIPYIVTILFIVNIIIALTIIFLERKNPSATLAWIMIIFLLPVVGIVFYVFFSQNISRQRIFRLSSFEEEMITTALNEQIKEMRSSNYNFANEEATVWQDMIMLHQTYANAYFTQDNKMSIMTDGTHMLDSLIKDIEEAKETINIMFFMYFYFELTIRKQFDGPLGGHSL